MVDHGDELKPVEHRVRKALRNCVYGPVQRVECEVRDGVLQLRGQLPTFYLKQIAQTVAAQSMRGQGVIENRIEVTSAPWEP